MAVNVDDRKLCLRHLVLGGHQRALRPVVDDARRRRLDGAWQLPGRVSVVPGGAFLAVDEGGVAAAALRGDPGADAPMNVKNGESVRDIRIPPFWTVRQRRLYRNVTVASIPRRVA